jgi:hypothetical protein
VTLSEMKVKRAEGVAKMVEHLSGKFKVLSSNTFTATNQSINKVTYIPG